MGQSHSKSQATSARRKLIREFANTAATTWVKIDETLATREPALQSLLKALFPLDVEG